MKTDPWKSQNLRRRRVCDQTMGWVFEAATPMHNDSRWAAPVTKLRKTRHIRSEIADDDVPA
jgi:hypothetical protein